MYYCRNSLKTVSVLIAALLVLAATQMTGFKVNASGQVDVGNVDPSIVSDGFYASDGVTSKDNQMIDLAIAGLEKHTS